MSLWLIIFLYLLLMVVLVWYLSRIPLRERQEAVEELAEAIDACKIEFGKQLIPVFETMLDGLTRTMERLSIKDVDAPD